jgi:site-specific recombinase XerD
MEDEVKGQMKAAVDIERVDYTGDREKFLEAAELRSPYTRDVYARAIARLESFCAAHGISVLELDPARADDFIMSERSSTCRDGSPRSSASVRVTVSGCSAFWTFMERRYNHLRGKNPFRGTKARPPAKAKKALAVPSDAEIEVMAETAGKPELRAAIVTMSRTGLRVGGLPSLTINGGTWRAHTKGKDQRGTALDEVKAALSAAGLSARAPFAGTEGALIAKAFAYHVRKLYAEGRIRARYSVHDLRHAYAVRMKKQTGDIYAVKTALGHSSVAVTETYLRSLDNLE